MNDDFSWIAEDIIKWNDEIIRENIREWERQIRTINDIKKNIMIENRRRKIDRIKNKL